MRRALRLAGLAILLVLVAPAAAQETTPVLVERLADDALTAEAGAPAEAAFRLFNLNPQDDFYVSISTDAPPRWRVVVSPNPFFLDPRNATTVLVTVEPDEKAAEPAKVVVHFSLVHGRTGEVTRVSETLDVASGAPPLILGAIPNFLPKPLDNPIGSFLLSVVAWILISIAAVVALDAIVRMFTSGASAATTKAILQKLRRPLFIFTLLYGFGESLVVLPPLPVLVFVRVTAVAVAIGIFGLFVLYKALDAVLFYYQHEIAPRTKTKIDDVVVPVLRKMGIVVLYVVGVILTMRTLGFDPTIVFAGAGIAGLVIAFAAQDTLSNFFSGLFLLLDRPFVEGDVILLETGEVARVENVGLRTTRLYEYDHHHEIVMPNNQLASRRITNFSAPDSNFKVDLFVGVAYDSDVRKVERILREIAESEPELVTTGVWAPTVQLRDFADSQMTFMLRVTLRDPRDRNRVPSKLRMEIREAFAREGIEIPFPQRVLHVKETRA